MNRIERMLQELCPDGVEYKKLGEVCEIKTGKGVTKQEAVRCGIYPIISGGKDPMEYIDIYNREANTVTISRVGAYAGYVNFICEKFYLNDKCFSIIPNNGVILSCRYLYFILKSKENFIMNLQSEGGVPTINTKKVGNIEIPVPPLPIQEEIVRILDHFTELTAELQAELQARQEQYEYYRNKLLTFTKIGGGTQSVTWMKMSDLFDIRNGYTPSKANTEYWENGTIPWFRMEDIRQNGRILSDSIQHITPSAVKGGRLFPANSFIIATTATIGEHALIIVDSLANQRFTNLQVRKSLTDKIVVKFLYYYMFIVGKWCKNNTNVSGFASVDMSKFKKLLIPIPSIPEQQRIVDILDKFETLVNDLSQGLPAEIAAVQEQYEYYRNKLLTFKRIA